MNVPSSLLSTMSCSSDTMNVEPLVYTLLTLISPPISSTSCLTMLSPSPVPSIWRFFVSSTRLNALKIYGIFSFFTPWPVSSTEYQTRTLFNDRRSHLTERVTEPSLVYFTALFSRLIKTCFTRTSSPQSILGMEASTCRRNSSPFSLALIHIMLTISEKSAPVSYVTFTISILPDLILDRSIMSLMRVSNILLAPWMFLAFSAISSEISPRRIISFNPIMVLIGVRIS